MLEHEERICQLLMKSSNIFHINEALNQNELGCFISCEGTGGEYCGGSKVVLPGGKMQQHLCSNILNKNGH